MFHFGVLKMMIVMMMMINVPFRGFKNDDSDGDDKCSILGF
jgi:hypothetical protein